MRYDGLRRQLVMKCREIPSKQSLVALDSEYVVGNASELLTPGRFLMR